MRVLLAVLVLVLIAAEPAYAASGAAASAGNVADAQGSNVTVTITYCGGCGYYSKFKAIENAIVAKYPKAKVTGASTPEMTGYLEVTVNGQLVHSKKNGDGYVDSATKLQKIMSAVGAAAAKS